MANIISLTVENFRSYKNKTVFTFEAIDAHKMSGNYHEVVLQNNETINLLNTAVIYGANAAGKSNMIIALWALYSFVKYSRSADPDNTIRYEPYMLSKKNQNAPIYFSIRFVSDGMIYDYDYSYNKFAFLSENLKEVLSGKVIFTRGENGVVKFDPEIPIESEKTYLRNHLALSELSLKAIPVIQSIYRTISSMRILPLTEEYYPPKNTTNMAAAMILDEEPNSNFSNMLRDLIVSSDTGIVGVSVKKTEADQFVFPESVSETDRAQFIQEHRYKINMVHATEEGDNILFPLNVESTGTQTLFKAGALVLKALEEGCLLVYDEMNIALHPILFRRLVELFNNKATNPNNAQLLVTTHDTVLIDDVLLRADQIWFAEKENGVSSLYSAIDFNGVKIDQPFGPWYKAGRLGGRPHLSAFTPSYGSQPSKIEK